MKRSNLIRTLSACASRRKRVWQAIHSQSSSKELKNIIAKSPETK